MPDEYMMQVNQYQLQVVIGNGSYGIVYLGWDNVFKRKVAVKEINTDRFDMNTIQGKREYKMVMQEIEISQKLKHINIVELYDYIKTESKIYLIFEYCSNGDLEKLFKKNQFTEFEVQNIFQQVINGVIYLQQQKVVHRDFKLANIYLNQDCIIKIGDFGFARTADFLMQSQCGTPLLMAPEVLQAKGEYTEKCDIWSLGMMLYIMIFGFSYLQSFITTNLSMNQFVQIVNEKSLIFPPKSIISNELRDLLKQMLTIDQKKRIDFNNLFKHKWIIEGQNDSLKRSAKIIRKRLNGNEQISDLKVPIQMTIRDQMNYQFGQLGLERNDVIELIRNLKTLCQNNEKINQICEKFLKKMRQYSNNFKIKININDQERQIISDIDQFKLYDLKYKLIYFEFKILRELHISNDMDLNKINIISQLNNLATNTITSNQLILTIKKECHSQLTQKELQLELDQIVDDLKEILLQQAKQGQRPHKKEYEIKFFHKEIGEPTLINLNDKIENNRLFFTYCVK